MLQVLPLLFLLSTGAILLFTPTVLGGTSCSCNRGYYVSSCYCSGSSCWDSCGQCPTGYYNDQNFYCMGSNQCSGYPSPKSPCKACDAGRFQPNVQQMYTSDCQSCASGTWSLEGSATCDKCVVGRGQSGTDNICRPCVVGKYQNQKIHTTCKNCPLGKTTYNDQDDGTGKLTVNDCIGCEIGTVVTTNNGQGNVLCTTCSAGQYRTTYSSNVGDTCTDCEVGKFITDDQSDPLQHDNPMDCNTCPAGFQYDTKAACVICEGGTYQDENNITAVTCKQCPMNTFLADDKGEGVAHDNFGDCMDCPNGKFAPPGQRFCENCQAGQIQNGTTASCVQCQSGYYSTGNENECISCLKGKYQRESGTTYCLPCLPGEYQNVEHQASCHFCPNGWYQNRSTGEHCYVCPEGYLGDVSHTRCIPCQEGRAGATCQSCTSGQYRGGSDNARHCLACPGGWSQEATESSTCYRCVPGKYNDQTNQTNCKKCLIGYYQDDTNQERCIGCNAGTYQAKEGQSSCIGCVPGQSQALKNMSFCVDCVVNTFANVSGLSTCYPCSFSRPLSSAGSAVCRACPSGTESLGSGTCVKCAAGLYRKEQQQNNGGDGGGGGDGGDAGTCQECPRGYFQQETGSASCLPCVPGKFNNGLGASVCKDCVSGQFSNVSLSRHCHTCLVGQSSTPNSARCEKCGKLCGELLFLLWLSRTGINN